MHPIIAQTTATRWIAGPRDAGLQPGRRRGGQRPSTQHQPDVVFLTSPNNPTGTALPLPVIEAVCAAAPGMVVVDEAYAEFARDPDGSALALLPRFPRLVVVRTMSKAFALAGARLGLPGRRPGRGRGAAAGPAALSPVRADPGRGAGRAAARPASCSPRWPAIRAERDAMVAWLREQGLAVADSDANFVLFGRFADRRAVWQELLDRGVLIREVGPPEWLRVSVGTPEEMAGVPRPR